jgi:hypothetical protein
MRSIQAQTTAPEAVTQAQDIEPAPPVALTHPIDSAPPLVTTSWCCFRSAELSEIVLENDQSTESTNTLHCCYSGWLNTIGNLLSHFCCCDH